MDDLYFFARWAWVLVIGSLIKIVTKPPFSPSVLLFTCQIARENSNIQKSTFGVVTLGPIVSSSRLSKDKIVGPENLSIRTGPDRVHGARLQVQKDRPWNVFASRSFVVVNVDTFQLEFRSSIVVSSGFNSMFIRDDLPELQCNK